MFNNKTKWIPLGSFNWDGANFIVFVRGNKKTGMLYFKLKRVNKRLFDMQHSVLPLDLIDVKKQWDKLFKMMEEDKIQKIDRVP